MYRPPSCQITVPTRGQRAGIVASRMSLDGSPLSEAEIGLLSQWIVDDAQGN
jgi:hypothetical protein